MDSFDFETETGHSVIVKFTPGWSRPSDEGGPGDGEPAFIDAVLLNGEDIQTQLSPEDIAEIQASADRASQ